MKIFNMVILAYLQFGHHYMYGYTYVCDLSDKTCIFPEFLVDLFFPGLVLSAVSPPGTPFPKAFIPTCKKILTRLYRVFVHVYIHHFDKIVAIGAVSGVCVCVCVCVRACVRACVCFHTCLCVCIYICAYLHSQEAHINTCYKHFYYFVTEFKLVETKEFEPLVSGVIGSGCHGFRCVSFVACSQHTILQWW